MRATWFSPISDIRQPIKATHPVVDLDGEKDPTLIAMKALNIASQRVKGEFSLPDLFDPAQWKKLSGTVRNMVGREFTKMVNSSHIQGKYGVLRKSEAFSTRSRNFCEIH